MKLIKCKLCGGIFTYISSIILSYMMIFRISAALFAYLSITSNMGKILKKKKTLLKAHSIHSQMGSKFKNRNPSFLYPDHHLCLVYILNSLATFPKYQLHMQSVYNVFFFINEKMFLDKSLKKIQNQNLLVSKY